MSNIDLPLRSQLAQKIMLDLRYYCAYQPDNVEEKCKQPVTQLPIEIAEMIARTELGGVILFAENLQDVAQITKLNHDLQQAAKKSKHKIPLFISVDQEGGRVARLPRELATSFSGSMAIGATYKMFGTDFASKTGTIIGKELSALGFNVNHAPVVDVNVNPNNPVINVRAFSENPLVVAELAIAQMRAMQQQDIIATLKHFPGHGDTSVDSHTGLPKVEHSLKTIREVDLAPFQAAINAGDAKMIMTAHIQYPHLDDSTFVASDGKVMIKPATMSYKILTELLRDKMGFTGVVITDALDMASISHFFNTTEAVIETFKAGADIALMPFYIRYPRDLTKLDNLLTELEQATTNGELNTEQVTQSAQRILTLKDSLKLESHKLEEKLKRAEKILSNPQHKKVEQSLAKHAVTELFNNKLLPIKANSKLHLVMPDQAKCSALTNALIYQDKTLNISCSDMLTIEMEKAKQSIATADYLFATNITPQQSPVELGGIEDIDAILPLLRDKAQLDEQLLELLKAAKGMNKKVLFISLRAPYEVTDFATYADAALATFSYNTHQQITDKKWTGPAYQALAKIITGKAQATGTLPVTVKL